MCIVGKGEEEENCNAYSQLITEEYYKSILRQLRLDNITVCSECNWIAASALGCLLNHSLIAVADFVAAAVTIISSHAIMFYREGKLGYTES